MPSFLRAAVVLALSIVLSFGLSTLPARADGSAQVLGPATKKSSPGRAGSLAVGKASNRSAGICRPHTAQRPYSPRASRPSASSIRASWRRGAANAAAPHWSPPQQIDDPALRSAGTPVLITDAAGNVRCAWYQDGPDGMQVQTARYNPAQQRWEAPQTLSDPSATVQASFPALAVNAAGSVMAVWQQFNGWRTLAVARWLP